MALFAQLLSFIRRKNSSNFLGQLTIGIIILVSGVTFGCWFSNHIMQLFIKDLTHINPVFILLHLMIIIYLVMLTRFIVQRVLKDKQLAQSILSLIGPTIGASSLYYSAYLKQIVI
jgi:hypothetical protein